jgi:DNA-binding transcriptional LysR family regulator
MDRIDAMTVFITTLDEGSLAAAGRRLGRSAAAVSRAIAFLEAHVGMALLHRTTRTIKLSEAGERYAVSCRQILADLAQADLMVAGERAAPRGMLTLTAPVAAGQDFLRPLLDEFVDLYPDVTARLYLLDRPANLIDEGIDVALRIAHLPDSTLIATPVGEVRRVVVAAPSYLARHARLEEPGDLAQHRIISMTHFGVDSWSFPASNNSAAPQTVHFTPRLIVNSVQGAVGSAVDGHGVTRLFSYHVAEQVHAAALKIVLNAYEQAPLPVHLLTPQGRLAVPKVRAFVDFALPRLRAHFGARKAITDLD